MSRRAPSALPIGPPAAGRGRAGRPRGGPGPRVRQPAAARLGVADQAGNGVDYGLGSAQHGDAASAQRCKRLFGRGDPAHHEGLLRLRLDLAEYIGQHIDVSIHQLQPDDGDMYAGIVEHRRHGLAQDRRIGDELRRHVDRIAERAETGDHRLQPGARRRAEWRHGQAQFFGAIGHEHACAARLGDDADTFARGRRAMREHLDQVEHVLFVARAHHAVLRSDAAEHRVLAGERTGMRSGGARTRAGASDLGQHQRFTGSERGLGKRKHPWSVLETLDIACADADARIGDDLRHHLRKRDVGFVAGIDEIPQPQAAAARECCNRSAERAGLGDEPDRARGRLAVGVLRERGGDALERVDEAQIVRSEHAHARGARGAHQFGFERAALLAGFGKSGTEHDGGANARAPAFADRAGHLPRGQRDDREVGRFRQGGHIRITGPVSDGGVFRIHRKHAAGVTFIVQIREHAPVELLRIRRCAEDGNRARREQRLQ